MNRAPRMGTPWLMRLTILAALVMLAAGIGMISGYFGGMPEPETATPVATSQAVLPTTVVSRTATPIIAINSSATPDTILTRSVAQSTAVGVIRTTSPVAQVGHAEQPSATAGAGTSNMATAMAVEAQSTSVAQSTLLAQANVADATLTAQVASLSTASAAGTAQANNDAYATATAVTAGQIAANQQTQQALQQTQQTQQTQQAQQAQQVQQQAQQTQQAQQIPATPTVVALGVVFEDDFYRGIDLKGATREQFGARAVLYSRCEGLSCWFVKSGAQVKPLDLKRAVARQYGADWTLVAVGAGKSDWRAVKFADLNYAVLPVMMVSSDRLYDVEGVNTGLARFRTVLSNSQYWYYEHVGKTFRLLQPVIVTTERTSAQWNNLSAMYTNKEAMAQATWSQYARQLPVPGNNLRVVVAPYTGENYAIAQGALSMPGFAVAPSLATSLWCPQSGQLDKTCQSASYLVGQALGLSFGLGHSCAMYPSDPKCHISLMQEGKPPGAMLLQPEIEKLVQSPFFTRY